MDQIKKSIENAAMPDSKDPGAERGYRFYEDTKENEKVIRDRYSRNAYDGLIYYPIKDAKRVRYGEETEQYFVKLPLSVKKRLESICEANGYSLSTLNLYLLTQFIDDYDRFFQNKLREKNKSKRFEEIFVNYDASEEEE